MSDTDFDFKAWRAEEDHAMTQFTPVDVILDQPTVTGLQQRFHRVHIAPNGLCLEWQFGGRGVLWVSVEAFKAARYSNLHAEWAGAVVDAHIRSWQHALTVALGAKS